MDNNEINLDIDFNEDYDLENIYINLKSPKLINIIDSEVFDIISNNGIVFKDKEGWKGTKESYLSINDLQKEDLNQLINIFDKYTNLYYLFYEHDNDSKIDENKVIYTIYVINKDLALGYFNKINRYLKDNYDLDEVNIHLIITNSNINNNIKNYSDYLMDNYLNLNSLQKILKKNFEFILPKNISKLINELKSKGKLDDENNVEIISKFKVTWLKVLKESNNYGSINLKIHYNEELIDISCEELNGIMKLI